MSSNRVRADRGKVNHTKLPKGPNGRALCRYCSREVPSTRKSYCSDRCVHEWKLRTQPVYLRACVLKRDDGRCARCRKDAIVLALELQILKRKDPLAWKKWYSDHSIPLTRKTMWDAHHKRAVVEGGGECGLEGLETLCVLCHPIETKALMRRRLK